MKGSLTIKDLVVALLLFAGAFGALGAAQRNLGVMRDEAYYFKAAEFTWGWLDEIVQGKVGGALDKTTITRYWSYNNEHPSLFKLVSAVSWRLFHGFQNEEDGRFHHVRLPQKHKSLGLMSEISAFRLPGWLFTALAVALIYLFGVRIEGRITGLAAALLYITIPRVFFHGQLACFDSAITTMWLATVYAYVRSLEKARWGIAAGVIFGFGLATKHNLWFVPALLLIHYLVMIWPDIQSRFTSVFRAPLALVSMAILGSLVFVALWPWLWFDTYPHIKSYFGFHLNHAYYNMEFLGKNWGTPPLPAAYPFVMTQYTVPLTLLALAAVGAMAYLRRPVQGVAAWITGGLIKTPQLDLRFRYQARRDWKRPGMGLDPRLGLLLVVNAVFPLVLIALPSTPIFGGTKHWMPAYPFMALLAGVALSRVFATIRGSLSRGGIVAVALAVAVAVPGALNTYLTHPYGLSQYNALAGGPAGGADLGLNRQFWGYPVRNIMPWINHTFDDNASVYFHDMNWDSYAAYRRDSELRADIGYAGMERPAINASGYSMVFHELHFNKYDYWIWDAYGTGIPTKVLHLDGVPILSVYERPKQR